MPLFATDEGWVWRFFLADATDDETAETGKSPTVVVCAVGATTFASPAATASELQRGWYEIALTTAELGTEDGEAICEAYDSGTDIYREKLQITDGVPAVVDANNVLTGYRLSGTGVNDIRDITIETQNGTAITLQHCLSIIMNGIVAISSGGGETRQVYRNLDNTVNRITLPNVQPTTGNRLASPVFDVTDLD